MHQPQAAPEERAPHEGQCEHGHPQALAAIEIAIGADVALLGAHPEQLVHVGVATARDALGSREHGQAVAALDDARIGDQIAREQEAEDDPADTAVAHANVVNGRILL